MFDKVQNARLESIFQTVDPANIYFSKSATIETIEEGVKYVQGQQYKHQNDVSDVVLVFLSLTLNVFHTFFYCYYC